ncbi:TPA: WxL domain-containing protein [Enterococcus faecalis]
MKLKNSLVCGALLLSMLAGGATQVFADGQTYPDSEHAKTTGSIDFKEDNEVVDPVDPTDPEKPVDPTDPTNPNGAELMLIYASNFKFGEQEKLGNEWNAVGDLMKDGTYLTPFVSTKDSRGTDRKGWTLTAALSKGFKDKDGNALEGAELELSNMFYSDKINGAPTAKAGVVTLSDVAQEVASADSEKGIGVWSLGLGELNGTDEKATTNGVTLKVPTTSSKNSTTYSAEITWELTAAP